MLETLQLEDLRERPRTMPENHEVDVVVVDEGEEEELEVEEKEEEEEVEEESEIFMLITLI